MDSILSLEVDGRGFVSEADRDAFFRQQFAFPENTSCFDCGFNNPNWTSLSFSIYLCLNCSGRHRQLGSHISFVRSVDMDRFTRDQLIRLSLGGNGKFNSFLNSENLLKKPLNYTNNRLLAYSAKLDAELSKYTGKGNENVPVDKNEVLVSNVVDDEASSEKVAESVVPRAVEGSDTLQSVLSSMRDDVEKLLADNNDTFSDLLDFGSVGTQDFSLNVSANPSITEVSGDVHGSIARSEAEKHEVVQNFEALKPQSDFNFDTVLDFVDFKPENLSKPTTDDSLFNLDLVAPEPVPSVAPSSSASSSSPGSSGRFSNLSGSSFSVKSNGSSTRATRNKFSSKVNDFDFESFEKQNVLQASFANIPAPVATAFGSTGPGGLTLGATSSAFGVAANRGSTATFGTKVPVNSPTLSSSSFVPAPASSPDRSLVGNPASSLHVKSVSSPLCGPIGFAAGSSATGNISSIVSEDPILTTKPYVKPDLSQFEGKKSISSDAFFGNTSTNVQTNLGNKVNPNTLAFSSDDYFGRPRKETPPVPTIEEQAIQNLNELKDNLVTAINKGSVLFEKAKQWLHTNYS
ncbi:ADP-ribosylation factor GTPase activating protein [Theileria orientalis]|uniref:ADP-ribosylation factor GTPase activating protein n=1 Tax=Theileria orientalis TaxID=68886 RepID=A0A976MCV9_THEOR|nr:ADP-ribosylation factor GTPase activating protein [Theileria orientalis]